MNPVRKACVHRIIAKGNANDDEVRCARELATDCNVLRRMMLMAIARYQYTGLQSFRRAPSLPIPGDSRVLQRRHAS
jgi:hypothetical protein